MWRSQISAVQSEIYLWDHISEWTDRIDYSNRRDYSHERIWRLQWPGTVLPGHRWIPLRGQWRWALMFSLIWAWTNCWANNGDTGDLRRHGAQYDVTVVIPWRISAGTLSTILNNTTALCNSLTEHKQLRKSYLWKTANMSLGTCVVVKQIQSKSNPILIIICWHSFLGW